MSATLTKPVSRPWRRFLRFSVRGMIVAVLLIGGWLGWMVHSARKQREAVAAIERTKSWVRYEWAWKDGQPTPNSRPGVPNWLVNALGVDYFGRVVAVGLSAEATDAEVAHVGRLSALDFLSITGTNVTDAGLAHLTGLTSLRVLGLSRTQVTDAGLAHLTGLTNVSDLILTDTRITDAGLAHLKGLVSLRVLWLSGTQITDAGLAHLKGPPKLEWVDVRGTQVSDAGKKELKQALRGLSFYQ